MSKVLINDIDDNCWSWQHCAWYVLRHSDTTLQPHPQQHPTYGPQQCQSLSAPFQLSGLRQFLTWFVVGYFGNKRILYINYLEIHPTCRTHHHGVKPYLAGKSTVGFPFAIPYTKSIQLSCLSTWMCNEILVGMMLQRLSFSPKSQTSMLFTSYLEYVRIMAKNAFKCVK